MARAVAVAEGTGDWRARMGDVRAAAATLAESGRAVVTQKGAPADAETARGPIRIALGAARAPSRTAHADGYRGIDFRAEPERYRVGRGEEGVLTAEPYKGELLPLWRFKTPELARESVRALSRAFMRYRRARDFVGMDMARKYMQMGFTRARRYANRKSGRKYAEGRETPLDPDPIKAASAAIFHEAWQRLERDRVYCAWRERQRTRRPRTTRA